jgi:dTDP-glucose 4,6-dehydratase
MKNILVTGGAGFIGSHLCERLLAEGRRVVCVDNLSTGRRSNIQHLADNSRFSFIEADIASPFTVDEPLDFVLDLASPCSPVDFGALALEILRAGSVGTLNMLELAHQKGAVFLLASTSEVYGDPKVHPQPESYFGNVNPIGPRAVYDESKRFSEAASMAYHRTRGLRVRIARIFNTYGPRMRTDDGRAIPSFIDCALSGKPLRVFGGGAQTRSFCFVSDLVDGLVRLAQRDVVQPTNLGNPHEMSIMELAQLVIKLTGSRSTIEHAPLPPDDPAVRRPDITLAKRLLGWEPVVPLEAGLLRTIEWFRKAAA